MEKIAEKSTEAKNKKSQKEWKKPVLIDLEYDNTGSKLVYDPEEQSALLGS